MSIPGLDIGPADELAATASGIELMSFSCEPFIVPAHHVFGKCRLITEFEKIAFLSEGTYGTVYKARDKRENKIVALTKLKIPKDEISFPIKFKREINILKELKHENIANLLDVAVGRAKESTYLINEYCQYSLAKFLDDRVARTYMRLTHVKGIICPLLSALSYLHLNLVLHRDLSAACILFTEHGLVKLTDFGICRRVARDDPMTPKVTSRLYRAPELLYGATNYTYAVDIWSAGCILAELLFKRPLFKADSDLDMISAVAELLGTPSEHQWPGFSDLPFMQNYTFQTQKHSKLNLKFAEFTSSLTLAHKIFTYNPKNRITAAKFLGSAFLTEQPIACDKETLVALLKQANEI